MTPEERSRAVVAMEGQTRYVRGDSVEIRAKLPLERDIAQAIHDAVADERARVVRAFNETVNMLIERGKVPPTVFIHPDFPCVTLSHVVTAAIAEEQEACASVAQEWADSTSCGVGGNPCEHQRLGATIAERIRART